jgi:hypothetical protein
VIENLRLQHWQTIEALFPFMTAILDEFVPIRGCEYREHQKEIYTILHEVEQNGDKWLQNIEIAAENMINMQEIISNARKEVKTSKDLPVIDLVYALCFARLASVNREEKIAREEECWLAWEEEKKREEEEEEDDVNHDSGRNIPPPYEARFPAERFAKGYWPNGKISLDRSNSPDRASYWRDGDEGGVEEKLIYRFSKDFNYALDFHCLFAEHTKNVAPLMQYLLDFLKTPAPLHRVNQKSHQKELLTLIKTLQEHTEAWLENVRKVLTRISEMEMIISEQEIDRDEHELKGESDWTWRSKNDCSHLHIRYPWWFSHASSRTPQEAMRKVILHERRFENPENMQKIFEERGTRYQYKIWASTLASNTSWSSFPVLPQGTENITGVVLPHMSDYSPLICSVEGLEPKSRDFELHYDGGDFEESQDLITPQDSQLNAEMSIEGEEEAIERFNISNLPRLASAITRHHLENDNSREILSTLREGGSIAPIPTEISPLRSPMRNLKEACQKDLGFSVVLKAMMLHPSIDFMVHIGNKKINNNATTSVITREKTFKKAFDKRTRSNSSLPVTVELIEALIRMFRLIAHPLFVRPDLLRAIRAYSSALISTQLPSQLIRGSGQASVSLTLADAVEVQDTLMTAYADRVSDMLFHGEDQLLTYPITFNDTLRKKYARDTATIPIRCDLLRHHNKEENDDDVESNDEVVWRIPQNGRLVLLRRPLYDNVAMWHRDRQRAYPTTKRFVCVFCHVGYYGTQYNRVKMSCGEQNHYGCLLCIYKRQLYEEVGDDANDLVTRPRNNESVQKTQKRKILCWMKWTQCTHKVCSRKREEKQAVERRRRYSAQFLRREQSEGRGEGESESESEEEEEEEEEEGEGGINWKSFDPENNDEDRFNVECGICMETFSPTALFNQAPGCIHKLCPRCKIGQEVKFTSQLYLKCAYCRKSSPRLFFFDPKPPIRDRYFSPSDFGAIQTRPLFLPSDDHKHFYVRDFPLTILAKQANVEELGQINLATEKDWTARCIRLKS